MKDPRIVELSNLILDYSVSLEPGEHVLIEGLGLGGMPLIEELIDGIYTRNAFPYVELHEERIRRKLLMGSSEKHLNLWADTALYRMKQMDVWIGIGGWDNKYYHADVPAKTMEICNRIYSGPVHLTERLANTKWTALNYPNNAMAQLAETSLESFEDFFFTVSTIDYSNLSKAMDYLNEMMEAAETVRITGQGTDLTFSIKGIPVIKCDGKENLPDGEVFTAPVKDSINGTVKFNCPSVERGTAFENIELKIKNGRIIVGTCNNNAALTSILDTDEGSRYFGEFAFGVNPYIRKPMKDPLFDEKIAGSFHLAIGTSYNDAPNGNTSSIHWDLVCIQTEQYGGGEIYFDGELIRRDGFFIDQRLADLNPAPGN